MGEWIWTTVEVPIVPAGDARRDAQAALLAGLSDYLGERCEPSVRGDGIEIVTVQGESNYADAGICDPWLNDLAALGIAWRCSWDGRYDIAAGSSEWRPGWEISRQHATSGSDGPDLVAWSTVLAALDDGPEGIARLRAAAPAVALYETPAAQLFTPAAEADADALGAWTARAVLDAVADGLVTAEG